MSEAHCRECEAPIVWATTVKGRFIPLDPLPDVKGHLVLVDTGKGALLARLDKPDDKPGLRYMAHWGTCIYADLHRKKK